jgi:transposase
MGAGGGGLGRPLACRLLDDRATAVDVPAKLSPGFAPSTGAVAARPIRLTQSPSPRCAAVSMRSAPAEPTLALPPVGDRRDDLVAQRSVTVDPLHALLLQLVPGEAAASHDMSHP